MDKRNCTASYLGQQLETNNLSSFVNHSDISFIGLAYHFSATISEDHYWHRQSGMLLEMKYEFHTNRFSGSDVLVGHFVLGAVAALSSPPVIPEFPSFLILPLFIVATLPPVIVYRRKCIARALLDHHTFTVCAWVRHANRECVSGMPLLMLRLVWQMLIPMRFHLGHEVDIEKPVPTKHNQHTDWGRVSANPL